MTEVLRLLQISDTHLTADRVRRNAGVCSYESLTAVLDQIRARDLVDCDALLLTGDLVNDDPGGYGHLLALFQPLAKPVLGLPGNHDPSDAMRVAFDSASFQMGGHSDFARWRLILLDSAVPGVAHGELSPAELQRLEAALGSADGRHVLIALHHHPVPLASAWLDPLGLRNAAEFFAIADRHPNIRAICWGHVHQVFDARRNGVRLMSAPSTWVQFKPLSEDFALDAAAPGYRRLELFEDGTIESEVVRVAAASAKSDA